MGVAGIDASISGYVLAGGASSRLGRDKVLLPWMGTTLLDHAIARLQQACETVSVCGNRPDLRKHLPPSMEIIPDAIAGCGPLGGIVAALERSHREWNLFLAVDLPLIPSAFLQRLIASTSPDHSSASEALCILPRVDDLPQPLCGLYHHSLAPLLRRALEEGKYKITHALRDTAGVTFLDMNAIIPSPGSGRIGAENWFLNINTEADLLRARELIRDYTPRIDKEP